MSSPLYVKIFISYLNNQKLFYFFSRHLQGWTKNNETFPPWWGENPGQRHWRTIVVLFCFVPRWSSGNRHAAFEHEPLQFELGYTFPFLIANTTTVEYLPIVATLEGENDYTKKDRNEPSLSRYRDRFFKVAIYYAIQKTSRWHTQSERHISFVKNIFCLYLSHYRF